MRKGWFEIEGVQRGDRTLAQQLKGLDSINFNNRSVLDLGCAEGLIAKHALDEGACFVLGIEVIAEQVEEAQRQCKEYGRRAQFHRHDLNEPLDQAWTLDYEVVLMLAILHKLRHPFALLEQVHAMHPHLCVVRLPASGEGTILDQRSNFVPYNVPRWFQRRGYILERLTRGHFDEWCGYFRRPR